jgi:D-threonate/D-erythronate kinase
MIAILADDFSGAAELAGIAAARGYKAEVQTVFDPASDAEVIAVDTDTRLKSEDEAASVVGEITRKVVAAQPAWIYKKTDSVMRGHIRAEIEAILDATGFSQCVFIPANPSKERVIRSGHYFVNGVPLDQTVFANDPDHPRRSSDLRSLLGESTRILSPDATSLEDLPHDLAPQTLAAGAADFFSALLPARAPAQTLATTSRTLLLCGSLAAWDTGRAQQMRELGFEVRTLDEVVSASVWQNTSKLMLAIGRPENDGGVNMTERLIETALPLLLNTHDLRIGLEGGATAIAFIRHMHWTRFEVIAEGHIGVGTLRPPGGPLLCVKPGSYPWPEGCLD